MGSVNVNRNVADQFYRYKMPRIIAKVEGKGNGIKTVLVNMVEVAKALNRPATYPTKYFGCELGAQTQFDFKNDRYIVNGSHDSQKLQSMLDGFIKKFVLCHECDNPETNLVVHQKKQTISQQCTACGHVSNVDMRHKVTTFILKNPPDHTTAAVCTSSSAVAKETKEKSKSKRKSEPGKNGNGSPHDKNNDSDEASDPKFEGDHEDGYDDWAEDVSEDAVAKRMVDLTDGAKGITLNEDLEKTQQERLGLFYNFVKKMKDEKKIEGLDKEILMEAERLDVKEKGPLILMEVLLDENAINQIKAHRIVFLRFTNSCHKAQKYLLGGFEQLVNVYKDSLMPKVPHLLKALYDADILEEEVLLGWASKPSKKYVSKELSVEIKEKAAPFIKWLKEAEEEESESEEGEEEEDNDDDYDDQNGTDEDGVEVVYSEKAVRASTIVKAAQTKPATNKEEDIDIDAI